MDANVNQFLSCGDPRRVVDGEHSDRRASNRCEADENGFMVTKVRAPDIRSGIKNPSDFARIGFYAGQIGSFRSVASRTAQGEVTLLSKAAMLPCDNVIEHVGQTKRVLRQQAILTAASGKPAKNFFERFRHESLRGRRVFIERHPCLALQNHEDVVCGEEVIELHPLIIGQLSELDFIGEFAVPRMLGLRKVNGEQSPGKIVGEIIENFEDLSQGRAFGEHARIIAHLKKNRNPN